jgi:hypothetical protein
MYDRRIDLPDYTEYGQAMNDYFVDAHRRFQAGQLLPGEQVHLTPEDVLQISGQTSVMQINALLVRVIFDKNPGHEFYIEESFPLDWMYPHLVPHGPILRIERRPLTQLPDDALRQDHESLCQTPSRNCRRVRLARPTHRTKRRPQPNHQRG